MIYIWRCVIICYLSLATASSAHEIKYNNNKQNDFDKQYDEKNEDEDTSEYKYNEEYGFSPPKKVKRDTKMVLIDGYTNQRVCFFSNIIYFIYWW